MKGKTILISDNNKEVIDGLNKTVDIIKTTMGAKGKYVTITDGVSTNITKDGVSVADAINLHGLEGIGSDLVKSSAKKTVSKVGDGTTATSVLLQALVNKSMIHLDGDINSIIKGMEKAVEDVIQFINQLSIPLEQDYTKLEQVATIASNSSILGKLIADCYQAVTMNSIVSLEKSSYSPTTFFEVREGIEFNSGMVHSQFSNSLGERCVFEDARIFIESKEIRSFTEVHSKILSTSLEADQPVVIIAPDFSKQFIVACVTNKMNKHVSICLIKSPGFGENVMENMKDIAAYTNQGIVDKIVITREKFVIYNEPTDSLISRVQVLEDSLEHITDEYEYNKTVSRIHKLQGTTGIIYTGGVTKESQSEEYDRLEDALGSVKASIRGGYVPGGGVALYKASYLNLPTLNDKETIGYKIVLEACQEPIKTILANANLNPQVVLMHFEKDLKTQGYNVLTDQYIDMIEDGIIDPTLVVVESLTNAFASTKLLINTKYNLLNQ